VGADRAPPMEEPLRGARSTIVATLRMPRCAVALFAGSAGVTAAHTLALCLLATQRRRNHLSRRRCDRLFSRRPPSARSAPPRAAIDIASNGALGCASLAGRVVEETGGAAWLLGFQCCGGH
jgi:hypothetical protein